MEAGGPSPADQGTTPGAVVVGTATVGTAVVGATLHVGDGRVIPDAVLVVRDGKIASVGNRSETDVPAGVRVVSGDGLHLVPGFIDLDARLFLGAAESRTLPAGGPYAVFDSVDPFDRDAPRALEEGVTTVAVCGDALPGGIVVAATVRSLAGPDAPSYVCRQSHLVLSLLERGARRSTSAERLESFHRLRATFRGALEHRRARERYAKALDEYHAAKKAKASTPGDPAGAEKGPEPAPKDPAPSAKDRASAPGEPVPAQKKDPVPAELKPPRPPPEDPAKEVILRAIDGEVPVLVRAERRDEIRHALRLAAEFSLRLSILGGTEGHRVLEVLAPCGAAVVVAPALLEVGALEHRHHVEENAAALSRAGIPVALASAGRGAVATRRIRLQATIAARGGLPPEDALAGITRVPARILGIDDRLGTLEPGKDADLVLLDGEPLDARSQVVGVAVEGRWAMLREDRGCAPLRPPEGSVAEGAARRAEESRPDETGAEGGRPEGPALVLANARIVTPDGAGVRSIRRGAILIRGGRIEGVLETLVHGGADVAPDGGRDPDGAGGSAAIPQDARVVDLDGRWVLPGFVDVVSHAGLAGETEERALVVAPGFRVLDALDPRDEELSLWVRRGFTSAALAPGAGNVVGGEIAVVKLSSARGVPRVVRSPAALRASVAPDFSIPRIPTSVAGALAVLEAAFREGAVGDAMAVGAAAGDSVAGAAVVLVDVPSWAAAERATEILRAAGRSVVLIPAPGLDPRAWAPSAGPAVPVVLTAAGLDARDAALRVPAFLAARGIPFAFGTMGSARDPVVTAALAVREGLGGDQALLALSSRPAEILGLAERIGSLRPGADADLVVWSGDPFSLLARVEAVLIDGVEVYGRLPGGPDR